MPKGKRIVVDASVARSAGWETTPDALSRDCREVLEGILRLWHRVVFSEDCLAEWRRHRSGYARRWLVQMFSRRKVILAEVVREDGLRGKLLAFASSESARAEMEKDCHLIEAALQYDRIILSRDEIRRRFLREAASQIREVASILWANPALEEDGVLAWLERGARVEAARRLGHPSRS